MPCCNNFIRYKSDETSKSAALFQKDESFDHEQPTNENPGYQELLRLHDSKLMSVFRKVPRKVPLKYQSFSSEMSEIAQNWQDYDFEFHMQRISENWMYEWMDDLKDFEKIEYPRHVNQRMFTLTTNRGKGKAFILKKIKDHIRPKTVKVLYEITSNSRILNQHPYFFCCTCSLCGG